MLVGLRWWSKILEDGSEEWIFECMQDDQQANKVDSGVFWIVNYVTPIVWLVFGIL